MIATEGAEDVERFAQLLFCPACDNIDTPQVRPADRCLHPVKNRNARPLQGGLSDADDPLDENDGRCDSHEERESCRVPTKAPNDVER